MATATGGIAIQLLSVSKYIFFLQRHILTLELAYLQISLLVFSYNNYITFYNACHFTITTLLLQW